jgi:pimeloyl-ACP methyl ester carboxylesterase
LPITFRGDDVLIDRSIHITHWGDVGPKLILIHGSAQGSKVGGDTCFSRQESLAAQGFQLVAPDRPGHGQSPAPGRPDDAEADGQWIAELFDDGVHVVGHSFGGACALNAVSRRAEKVRSLTLIEPAMFTLVMDDARVRKFVLGLLATKFFSFSATRRVRGFAKHMHIPADIHGGASDEEMARMDKGLSQLKLPSRQRGTNSFIGCNWRLEPGLHGRGREGIDDGWWAPCHRPLAASLPTPRF